MDDTYTIDGIYTTGTQNKSHVRQVYQEMWLDIWEIAKQELFMIGVLENGLRAAVSRLCRNWKKEARWTSTTQSSLVDLSQKWTKLMESTNEMKLTELCSSLLNHPILIAKNCFMWWQDCLCCTLSALMKTQSRNEKQEKRTNDKAIKEIHIRIMKSKNLYISRCSVWNICILPKQ